MKEDNLTFSPSRFGEWHEVVIDDRLPTRHNSLIYLRSKEENEFWCSLIEKAYAKWYGSYQALTSGLASEAAVDFTGGVPEKINLDETKMSAHRIFHIMRSAFEKGAFIASSILVSFDNYYECTSSRHIDDVYRGMRVCAPKYTLSPSPRSSLKGEIRQAVGRRSLAFI